MCATRLSKSIASDGLKCGIRNLVAQEVELPGWIEPEHPMVSDEVDALPGNATARRTTTTNSHRTRAKSLSP